MLQKKTKFLLGALAIGIVCACFLISPKYGCAQDGVQVWGEGDIAKTAIEGQTGMRAQDPRITIVNIIRIGLGFLGVIAVIIIIYAGYLWMTAGGSAEQIEKAKMLMRNAVIGLVIILSSFAIVSFILSKLINATGGEGGWDIAGGGNFPPGGGIYGCADPATSCGDATCVAEISSVPYVCAISPQTGPKGAYVTIKGYHFGEFKEGTSKVLFGEYEAEIVLCPGDNNNPSWRDNRIVAIVPSIDIGNYSVKVINGNSKENSVTNQKTFKVTDGVVPPGIACIIPDEGKENEDVEIYGDYFGDEQVFSKVLFNKEKEAVVNNWTMKQISATVPGNSLSGDVFAYVNGLNSNGYPFKVLCDKHEDCSSGCCYNSSYCLDLAECVGASCDSDKEASLCQVGEGCALSLICRDDNCACRLPGENEPCSISKDSCVQGICADNLTCGADCKCHDLPGIGQKCLGGCTGSCKSGLVCGEDCVCREKEAGDPCDADLNAIGCQIGDCGNNLTCNSDCRCNSLPNEGESCDSADAPGCQLGECFGSLSCDSGDCLCKALPIIDWIEPSDGAPGNLVTIGGVNFGEDKGKVQFVIGETIVDARLAGEVNRDCELGEWNDTKIIVEVPKKGLEGGEGEEGIEVKIRVIPKNSEFSDEKNFLVNDIVRPGLCAAYKIESGEKISSGEPLENLYLAGINLKNIDTKEEITFGSDVAGENPLYDPKAKSTVITNVTIPNLLPDVTNIFVEEAISKEKSNPVIFTILESSLTPRIDGFEPKAAHPGDYVRIYGQGFGSAARQVNFGGISGNFSFPDECLSGGGYWKDSEIIVKVPVVAGGKYKIKVVINEIGQEIKSRDKIYIGDYCSHDYGACGEGEDGEGCSGRGECVKSVSPGLCKIMPIMGPAKTPVSFYGENFGASIGRAEFNGEKEIIDAQMGKTVKTVEKVRVTPSDWTKGTGGGADIAKANVPIKDPADNMPITPITGQIKIISASSMESNGLRFEVGSCEADAQCNISGGNTSFVCCGDTSEYKGACMENQNACGFVLSPPTDYIWSFSTESPTVPNCAVDYTNEAACNSSGYCCWLSGACAGSGCPASLVPSVKVQCDHGQSCNNDAVGPSPSPSKQWPNGESACVDSIIRADFSTAIIQSTLTAEGNIMVIECGDSENLCESAATIVAGAVEPSVMSFSFTPSANLKQNTWHKVILKANQGIKAADKDGQVGKFLDGDGDGIPGEYEQDNFIWTFKTRNDNKPCEIGCAFVNPAEYTAPNTDLIRYTGNLRGKENVCELLRGRGEEWKWSSDQKDFAKISAVASCCADITDEYACSEHNNWKCVEPIKETEIDPVKITGTVKTKNVSVPVIDSIMYRVGAPGDIIPIQGFNFGNEKGDVIFIGKTTTEEIHANFAGDVKLECSGKDWSDSRVIFEVPQGAVKNEEYTIRITTKDGLHSDYQDFLVNDSKVTFYANCEFGKNSKLSSHYVDISDTAKLYIDFSDFSVESFWPDCQESCLNAAVGARFSGEIYAATIEGNVLIEGGEGVEGIEGEEGGDKEVIFKNLSLNVNTNYRVIIKGGSDGVRNNAGGGLDGLNYDSDGDKISDSFSWEFKTGEKPCEVDSVSVEPVYGVVGQIGAGLMYSAEPKTVPDICKGQRLDAYSYDWRWATSTPANSPQDVIYTDVSDYPECGNGIVEKGEDCDEGEWVEGKDGEDGREGNDGTVCSATCTNVGNTKKCGALSGCCGNGATDSGEECDGQEWCSDKCLLKGSNVSYNSFCGNGGALENGEECELGKQGCSSICLWMGTATACSEDITENCCGNGQIDEGGWEECDEGANGNKDDGVGCSFKCLREGVAKCSGECCGNGRIDAGEDCDEGKWVDGEDGEDGREGNDGTVCSAICTNAGIVACSDSVNKDCCGNGVIEAGEDCDEGALNGKVKDGENVIGCSSTCANAGTVKGSIATSTPYQLVKAIDGPAAGQTAATTDITATEAASLKSGIGKFTIQCGAKSDNECPNTTKPDPLWGVGKNTCCYPRPKVVSIDPNPDDPNRADDDTKKIENLCPNGAIVVTFDQVMDKDGLEKAGILEKNNGQCECGKYWDGDSCEPEGNVLGETVSKVQSSKFKVQSLDGEEGKEGEEGGELEIGPSNTAGKNWKLEIKKLFYKLFDIFIGNGLIGGIWESDSFGSLTPITSKIRHILAGLMNFAKADGENWCKARQTISSSDITMVQKITTIQLGGEEYKYNFEISSIGESLSDWILTNKVQNSSIKIGDKVSKYVLRFLNQDSEARLEGSEQDLYGIWDISLILFNGRSSASIYFLNSDNRGYNIELGATNIRFNKLNSNNSITLLKEQGGYPFPLALSHIRIKREKNNDWNIYIKKDNNFNLLMTYNDGEFSRYNNFSFKNNGEPSKYIIGSLEYSPFYFKEIIPEHTGTTATIMPSELLDSSAEYRLNFDGLKNIYGVATASTADANKIKVSARSEICLVDRVDVLIDYTFSNATTTDDIFICAGRDDCGAGSETVLDDDADEMTGNQHLYRANALDKDGSLLAAQYVWLEHDSYNTSQSVGAIKIEDSGLSQKYITASHLDEAKASVEIGAYDGYGYNSAATSTIAITLDMCNNPWPPISEFPYNNDEYNYGTHFCRDAGDINTLDDLPGLKTTGQAGGQGDGIIDEELWVED